MAGLASACGASDASEPVAAGSNSGPASIAASASSAPPTQAAADLSEQERVVLFSNWPGYIDEPEEGTSTLQDFTAQTGIDVSYNQDINSSNEFFAKVQAPLEQGQSIDRDIVVLSEEGVDTFIANGFAAPLDKSLIPNWTNLLPELRNPPYDPGRRYSLPWQCGFTGIGWNTPLLKSTLGVDRITSLKQFFDPRLKGRVTVLVEMVDTMGLMLNWLGFDMGNFTPDEFNQALDALQQKVDDGFIRQAMGNDYIGSLESGDAIASFGWSGDVLALGDDYDFALPESGGMVWADAMLIPTVASHKANAERLMNYYYDPAVAARLAAWVQYMCPVQGAQEAMEKVDPTLVDDAWIFPTPELLSTASEFMLMTPAQRDTYMRDFARVME